MIEAVAELDWETSENAGASGTFQVVRLTNTNGGDLTKLVDQGMHFHTMEQVAAIIEKKTGQAAVVREDRNPD